MNTIASHYQAAIDRLATEFAAVPEVLAILAAVSTQVQAVEDALWQLLTERTLDAAVGAQLDVIGKIVMRQRGNASDEVYRLELKAQVKTLLSSGGPEELLGIFALLHSGAATLEESFPAGFTLHLEDEESFSNLEVLLSFLRDAKAEGIDARLHVLAGDQAGSFQLAGPMFQHADPQTPGDTALPTVGDIPADFPAQGSCVVGVGLPEEEVCAYLSHDASTIILAPPGLVNSHDAGGGIAAVVPGGGCGDYNDPDVGGAFSGVWQAE